MKELRKQEVTRTRGQVHLPPSLLASWAHMSGLLPENGHGFQKRFLVKTGGQIRPRKSIITLITIVMKFYKP
jgi:hypothetical protein